MKEGKHLYRGLMLKALLDKEYYNPTTEEMLILIASIEEDSREALAKRMIPLIEQSETEEEALILCQELAKKFPTVE